MPDPNKVVPEWTKPSALLQALQAQVDFWVAWIGPSLSWAQAGCGKGAHRVPPRNCDTSSHSAHLLSPILATDHGNMHVQARVDPETLFCTKMKTCPLEQIFEVGMGGGGP